MTYHLPPDAVWDLKARYGHLLNGLPRSGEHEHAVALLETAQARLRGGRVEGGQLELDFKP